MKLPFQAIGLVMAITTPIAAMPVHSAVRCRSIQTALSKTLQTDSHHGFDPRTDAFAGMKKEVESSVNRLQKLSCRQAPGCAEQQAKLGEMLDLAAKRYKWDHCTDACAGLRKEIVDLANQVDKMGCWTAYANVPGPYVNFTAPLEPRRNIWRPNLSGCDDFRARLLSLNHVLASNLTGPPFQSGQSNTSSCVAVHESLPEIDIWSNRCVSQNPDVGVETAKLVHSLQRMGCIWNSTCGPACPHVGDEMFDIAKSMGPMQCSRFDNPGGPRKRETEQPAVQRRHKSESRCARSLRELADQEDFARRCQAGCTDLVCLDFCPQANSTTQHLLVQVQLDCPYPSLTEYRHNDNATARTSPNSTCPALQLDLDILRRKQDAITHHYDGLQRDDTLLQHGPLVRDIRAQMDRMHCPNVDPRGPLLKGIPETLQPRDLPSVGSRQVSAIAPTSPTSSVHERSCNVILRQRAAVDQSELYYISNHLEVPYYLGDWRDHMYYLIDQVRCEHGTNGTSPVATGADRALTCEDVIGAMTDLDHLTLFYFHNVDSIPDWLWNWQRFMNTLAQTLTCTAPDLERAKRLAKRLDRSVLEENCVHTRQVGFKVDAAIRDYARQGRTAPQWALSWLVSLNHIEANLGCDSLNLE